MEEVVEIEEGFKLKPFTKDDLKGMNDGVGFCDTCMYVESCITLDEQNRKAQFRDGINDVSRIWGCTMHTTEEEALEEMEEEENQEDVVQ